MVLFAIGAIGLRAQTPSAGRQTTVPSPTDYQVVQQDANSQVWQRETYENGPSGEVVTNFNSYTELASGLNHWVGNQWVESKEEIDIQPDGTASATQGQHQVFFPSDILNGEIELVTPGGQILKSQPVGLSYDDGTNTVLIGVLTNSIGQVVNTNQVIYTNAFAGLDADLLFTFRRSGFEQDVVLRQQPPTPGSLGLNAATTRLQVLTEFFHPPQPGVTASALPEQSGLALTDDTLDFGLMQMVQGKAFLLGENTPAVNVGKSWLATDGRQFLVEAVPVMALTDELESLPPASTAQIASIVKARVISKILVLPPQHLAKASTHPLKLARSAMRWKPGVVLDYNTINSSLTNYTFQGDTTYYLSGTVNLYGTNTFEGGTVLKYASGVGLNVYGSQINWEAGSYRPVIFTAKDDNYDGQVLTGSTGSPSGYYANPALAIKSAPNLTLTNYRVKFASEGIVTTSVSLTNYDCKFIDCGNALTMNSSGTNGAYFRNALFANVLTNFILVSANGTWDAQNATFSDVNYLFSEPSGFNSLFNLTKCLVANLTNIYAGAGTEYSINGANNAIYQGSPMFTNGFTITGKTPLLAVGSGSYYLTTSSSCHNAGTTNIVPALLSDLAGKTTYPPFVYSGISISNSLVLGQFVSRDTNGTPDVGYHYDPLDYVFGGCSLSSNLTISAGTAVGWYENPYGIGLNDGANLTFNGTVTAPCWMARYAMVQENVNIVWPGRNIYGGVYYAGGGSGASPQVNANFTKWSVQGGDFGHIGDSGAAGTGIFRNCEFYIANIQNSGLTSLYFTNCLCYRLAIYLFDQDSVPIFSMDNCTWYNGMFVGGRLSNLTPEFWAIENTTFDGTGFYFNDYWNGSSSYTLFNYNAYNTNNLSGLSFPYPYNAPTNYLEVVGPNDRKVGTYNWQSGWFGSFYLPTNSPIINMGSTNANLLGLYHFTTQTNQSVEGDSIVDIGYHYVATGTNGLPLDSNGDGIPDYLEDPLGNGLPYNGTNWALAILTQPYSQTNNQGSNVTFSVVADGVLSLNYQWYFNSTEPIAGANTSSLTLDNIQYGDIGNYSVVVTNQFGSITSSVVSLTVNIISVTFTNFCDVSILQINGNAQQTNTSDGCVLELTPATYTQAGSAFLKAPLPLTTNASFSTFFSFRLSKGYGTDVDGVAGADGISFIIQTFTNNIGSLGGGLGYQGISNSVAIEFDTWYNDNPELGIVDPQLPAGQTNANGTTGDGNHVGVDVNGSLDSIAYAHIPIPMNNSNVWYAWIDYNGATSNLQVRVSETNSRPVVANLTNTINVLSYLGKNTAYVGFGGGTGSAYNQEDILSWQINPLYNPIVNTNPITVQILSPTNGQLFVISPTNIMLTAVATSNIGAVITSVVFTNQTTSTGLGAGIATTNGTYQLLWQDVMAGTNNLTVTAYDNFGNVATNGITVIINALPVVNFISPTNTQFFSEVANVKLSVSASDSDATVTDVLFYAYSLNTNTLLGSLATTNGGGSYNLTYSNRITGVYPIFAAAKDNRGSESVSPLVMFQVNPSNG